MTKTNKNTWGEQIQYLVVKAEVNVDFVPSDMQIRKRSEKYFLCESMQSF